METQEQVETPDGIMKLAKEKFGANIVVILAKIDSYYEGEVIETEKHLIQKIDDAHAVIHEKGRIDEHGQLAHWDKSMTGLNLKINYEGEFASSTMGEEYPVTKQGIIIRNEFESKGYAKDFTMKAYKLANEQTCRLKKDGIKVLPTQKIETSQEKQPSRSR